MIINESKVQILAKYLQVKKGRTVTELAERADMSVRTVYRYLKLLAERGHAVTRADPLARPTRYRISS